MCTLMPQLEQQPHCAVDEDEDGVGGLLGEGGGGERVTGCRCHGKCRGRGVLLVWLLSERVGSSGCCCCCCWRVSARSGESGGIAAVLGHRRQASEGCEGGSPQRT